MQLITGEFLILAVLIYFSKYVRSRYSVIEGLLRGCVVFFPPEVNSKDKNMTFVTIDDKFSLKSPFFSEFEVLSVIFYMTLGLVSISALLQFNPWITMGSTVSFYMILMAIMTDLYGLYKQNHHAGLANPEIILSCLYSLILFFALAILLNSDHAEFLDFNFKLSSELLQLQVISSLKANLPASVKLSIDYFLLACLMALVAVICMLPTFRYVSKFVHAYLENPAHIHKKQQVALIIAPMVLTTLWIKPMTKNFLVGYFGEYFAIFRWFLVFAFCFFRVFYLRNEVQAMLNRTSKLVQDVLMHPKKENIEICNRKCRAIGTMTWPYAHLSFASSGLVVLFLLALITRGELMSSYPQKVTEQVRFKNPNLGFDDEEFFVQKTTDEYLTKTMTYVKEIKALEQAISEIESSKSIDFSDLIVSVSRKSIVHPVFYRDTFEFLIWSMCFGWSLVTVVSFVIFTVSPTKTKTS
jgi:hypothetical protein